MLQKLRGVVPQLPDKATIEELQCDLNTSQTSLDGLEQTNDMMFSPLTVQASAKRIRNLQQVNLALDYNRHQCNLQHVDLALDYIVIIVIYSR